MQVTKIALTGVPLLAVSALVPSLVPWLVRQLYGIDDIEAFLNTHKKSSLKQRLRTYYNAVAALKASWVGRVFGLKPEYGGVVSELIIYPIKSISQGLHVRSWEVGPYGLKYDRQYMLVRPDNGQLVVLNHSQQPRLGVVRIDFERDEQSKELDGVFRFTYPLKHERAPGFTGKSFTLPARVTTEYLKEITGTDTEHVPIKLWLKDMSVVDISAALPDDFMEQLNLPKGTRLVYSYSGKTVDINVPSNMLDTTRRFTKFQDYFPALMLSVEDVQDLQARIHEAGSQFRVAPVSFRPNIVLENTQRPFDTDNWYHFDFVHKNSEGRTERHAWRVSLKCLRCNLPNVDLSTGEFDPTALATKVLSKYRRVDEGSPYVSCFGVYVTQYDSGYTISAGDVVEVLQRKAQYVVENPFVPSKVQKKRLAAPY